jgi:DNA-binding transcriptional MocR family regulator
MSLTEPPNNGVALWRRVADSIEQAIADGTYPRDTRLPGELEIAEVHRVNRHTVRRALAALAERGLVAPNAAVAPMSKRPASPTRSGHALGSPKLSAQAVRKLTASCCIRPLKMHRPTSRGVWLSRLALHYCVSMHCERQIEFRFVSEQSG